jgi:hypothetical protein
MAYIGHPRQKVVAAAIIGLMRSSSAFSGLPTSVAMKLEVQDLRAWLESPLAHAGDRMLCAFIELRRLEVRMRFVLG